MELQTRVVRAREAVARADLKSVQLRDVLHALTTLMMYMMTCTGDRGKEAMAIWAFWFVRNACGKKSEIRVQKHDGNEVVAPSQLNIRNLDTRSGIAHLGHPDIQEAVLTMGPGG